MVHYMTPAKHPSKRTFLDEFKPPRLDSAHHWKLDDKSEFSNDEHRLDLISRGVSIEMTLYNPDPSLPRLEGPCQRAKRSLLIYNTASSAPSLAHILHQHIQSDQMPRGNRRSLLYIPLSSRTFVSTGCFAVQIRSAYGFGC